MIPVQTTYLRPRSGIILLMLIPVLLFVVIANITTDDTTLKIVSGLFLLVPVAIYIFVINSYIEFDNDGITHKNPFKTKSIQWKEVTRSYFRVIHTGKSSRRLWNFENDQVNFRFATNLYSRKALQTIAGALITKCPDAQIDQKIRNMAEGKFPWYIF